MTVATRTFQSIQPKTPLEDQKSRVPINQALQYLSGALQADIDTAIAAAIAAVVMPAFSAHKNGSDQGTITSGGATVITFGTEEFDIGSYFDSNAWTPPSGKHLIAVGLTFTAANGVDTELLELRLLKNGVVYRRISERRGGVGIQSVHLASTVTANGTDAFTIAVFKSGAGDGTVEGDAIDTWFTGHMI